MNQREIKFRAWSESKESFVTNDDVVLADFETHMELETKKSGIVLEQFTGLKDKNGNGIYEGDIVRFDGHTNEDKFTAAIEFRDGKFCDSYYGWEIGKYREIIGNIHENPELVAGKES